MWPKTVEAIVSHFAITALLQIAIDRLKKESPRFGRALVFVDMT